MSNEAEQSSANAAAGDSTVARCDRRQVEDACVAWQAELKLFLLGVLKDRHLVEDVFQRSVLRAIASCETARPETLRGWLFRVALNEARQWLREQKRAAHHFGRLVAEQSAEYQVAPEEHAVAAELVEAMRRSLEKLPTEQADVVRRRLYLDQTFAEISEELSVPLGTVLTWMRRGLMKLKDDPSLRRLGEM